MLRLLADLASRRPRLVLVLTLVAFLAAGFFGAQVVPQLSTGDDFEDPGSESVAAAERIVAATGSPTSPSVIVLIDLDADVEAAESQARVAAVEGALAEAPGVAEVLGVAITGDPAFVAESGRATYLALIRDADLGTTEFADGVEDAIGDLEGVRLGGPALAGDAVGEQVGEDLARAELIALPILLILSFLVFRSVVAGFLPIVVGVLTIVFTLLGMRLVNEGLLLSVFALNLVIALGLGLAIDYSLFVVSRYREELARAGAGAGAAALRRTLATAGRTVVFSALTVAAALLSLTIFPQRFLYSMGIAGALAALVAGAVAIVVLPAILALLGPRVNGLSFGRWRRSVDAEARGEERGFWYRLSRAVMRRPGAVAIATAAVLVLVGLPFLGIRFTGVDASVLPADSEPRQVYEALREDFPADQSEPLSVLVDAPADAGAALGAYAAELGRLPSVASVDAPAQIDDGLWRVRVRSEGEALAEGSLDLVRALRAEPAPGPVAVTGAAAVFVDQQATLGRLLPVALAILALTTLVILFLMTGSVLLPVKSLVMNLLGISAAFGLLVLVFQDGRLEGLLAYESQGAIESTQTLVLLAVAFGLSTDYTVFLLTRIKEAREAGRSNEEAVAVGLQRTGRIVTAAAVLFSVALGAFATSEIIFIKQVGLGTVAAVLIDAFIIRALLVPALMKLLGEWNWWAPGPLRRLHARIGLGEGEAGRT